MTGLYSAGDYAGALHALLPRGRVWPDDADSVLMQIVVGLAAVYANSDEDGQAMLADAFPVGTIDLLPEWEETLGLPDPCAGPDPTLAQRQAGVAARLVAGAGLSPAHFISFAQALGFTISIERFAPARAGIMKAGDPVNDVVWAYAWRVTITADQNNLGAAVLACELNAIKPAATTLIVQSA